MPACRICMQTTSENCPALCSSRKLHPNPSIPIQPHTKTKLHTNPQSISNSLRKMMKTNATQKRNLNLKKNNNNKIKSKNHESYFKSYFFLKQICSHFYWWRGPSARNPLRVRGFHNIQSLAILHL